jgi:ribonuclease G
MVKEIVINATPYEKRIAILEDSKLAELLVDQPELQKVLSNIYKGRVQTVLPGMQSAFVDIGLEKSAFLHISQINDHTLYSNPRRGSRSRQRRYHERPKIQNILKEGQEILVQIIKEPISTKGAKITTTLSLAGRFLVLLPDTNFIGVTKKIRNRVYRSKLKKIINDLRPPNIGFIVRTIGLHVSETEFKAEIKDLIKKWESVKKLAAKAKAPALLYKEEESTLGTIRDLFSDDIDSLVIDSASDYKEINKYLKKLSPELLSRVHLYQEKTPIFDAYDIEDEIEKSLKRKIWLKGGGYILFDETEAMTVVDVNTGRFVGKKDLESTILQTNLYAAREIAKQLRLRDIGGIIVIDFIDMEIRANRNRVVNELKLHIKNDRTLTKIGDLSEFGIVEMTRKRVRTDLVRRLSNICELCNGSGRVISEATILSKVGRLLKKISTLGDQRSLCLVVGSPLYESLTKERNKKLKEIEKNYRIKLKLLEDPNMHLDEYRILTANGEHDLTQAF